MEMRGCSFLASCACANGSDANPAAITISNSLTINSLLSACEPHPSRYLLRAAIASARALLTPPGFPIDVVATRHDQRPAIAAAVVGYRYAIPLINRAGRRQAIGASFLPALRERGGDMTCRRQPKAGRDYEQNCLRVKR